MASNYTSSYQLCQWEAEDKVLRTDFNGDNAKIDAALKANADAISAEVSARTAAISAEASARAAVSQAVTQEAATRAGQIADLTEYTQIQLLETASLSESGTSLTIPLNGLDWGQWRLVHLIIAPKMSSNTKSCSLMLNGNGSILTVKSSVPSHLILFSWRHPELPVRGICLSPEGELLGTSSLFQNVTHFTLEPVFDSDILLSGTTVSVYGEK